MRIDGRCHCGYITFEAEADPDKAGVCHCTDCQSLSGSAFRTFLVVTDGTFRNFSGEPTVYVELRGKRHATRTGEIGPEPGTMPSNDGLRPDDCQVMSNIRKQTVEADEYQPVEDVEAEIFGVVRRRTMICW